MTSFAQVISPHLLIKYPTSWLYAIPSFICWKVGLKASVFIHISKSGAPNPDLKYKGGGGFVKTQATIGSEPPSSPSATFPRKCRWPRPGSAKKARTQAQATSRLQGGWGQARPTIQGGMGEDTSSVFRIKKGGGYVNSNQQGANSKWPGFAKQAREGMARKGIELLYLQAMYRRIYKGLFSNIFEWLFF